MKAKNRDTFVDIVKGWGIILVIWGHSSSFLFDEIYSFHMPLFFFLSGCFFSTKLNFVDFVKKKFKQLILPYIFFFIISCIYYWLLLFFTNRFETKDFLFLIKIFPYDNNIPNAPLWFFYALFWMSIIYYLLRRFIHNDLLILLIVIILHLAEYIITSYNITLPAYFDRSLREVVYMHLGFLLYNRSSLFKCLNDCVLKNIALLIFSLIVFILLYNIQIKLDKNIVFSLISVVTAFVGIIFSLYLCSLIRIEWLRNILDYLGNHTLCLFSIHLPLYEISRPIAKILFAKGSMGYDIVSFVVVFVLSLIVMEILMFMFPKFLGESLFVKKQIKSI